MGPLLRQVFSFRYSIVLVSFTSNTKKKKKKNTQLPIVVLAVVFYDRDFDLFALNKDEEFKSASNICLIPKKKKKNQTSRLRMKQFEDIEEDDFGVDRACSIALCQLS